MLYACLVVIKLVAAWLFSYVVFLILFFLQVETYNVYVIMMLKVQ